MHRDAVFTRADRGSAALPLLLVLLVAGCGAPRTAGEYSPTPAAENPWILTLAADGAYTWRQRYGAHVPVERGRWWRIDPDLVVLLPDDHREPHRFARIATEPRREVRFSHDLRALAPDPPAP